ncbi:MAG: DegT/DnrJ/EryC1/StrS family aminotransferase [Ignavibacteria bacterium]|jgi:dTDP-4-amino-4,6-dideoxygalactose transaminase|nr:DegT/DnrJ/EryC1/StrS family aminotransferase [Ignavibacteria bacterium]MCU7498030.1 DegT/DnrJ/EryC1/StrS family aminotransferase [Ignavibacteria bacterium]MCU7512146.1 DegT/DnrJ/EryC1/StrS family aminotransferase [Ignavibacteria bacterium]MCU7520451.1 DegT/DnrJ/EryC1/StrS family aminotransferase [Ignavibacteria bacterium]MCU7523868.1 DegT/DnrJ/EryC1/StrS family aminotransferase [Ignavibacteria bacterium]
MEVPFQDLKSQYKSIKDEVNRAIQEVLDSSAFILGKAVSEFEQEFALAQNVKHCIGLSSGTDGNHAVLWALGIKEGDEVIIPVNTFIATAWGATLNGAKPVFVDCDAESYNIAVPQIEQAVTPNTRALVAVHLYGQAADLDSIRDITDKNNIYLVEDCAQAHLAEYKGQRVGGLSEAASFSFYPGKNLGAYGEAGAATTNNDLLAKKIRMIREHGSSQKYNHEIFGHNYRMEGIQGAVLGVKLKYLEEWTEKRRTAAKLYNEYLSDIEEIKLPREMSYAKHVYHLYVVQLRSGLEEARNRLADYLKENRIATGLHYPVPLHLQKCFSYLGYKKGDFPVAEKLASGSLSLPMFPELTESQIKYVAEKIRSFFKAENIRSKASVEESIK